MKVCVPTEGTNGLDESISQHFGRAPAFAIVDSKTMECNFIENTSEHYGGSKKPPEIIADAGADVVLAAGMGPTAIQMFSEMGIKVYCGISGTVRKSLEAYKAGKLSLATEEHACKDQKH